MKKRLTNRVCSNIIKCSNKIGERFFAFPQRIKIQLQKAIYIKETEGCSVCSISDKI